MFTLTPTIGYRYGQSVTELSAADAAERTSGGDPEWREANLPGLAGMDVGMTRDFAGPYGANWRVRREA